MMENYRDLRLRKWLGARGGVGLFFVAFALVAGVMMAGELTGSEVKANSNVTATLVNSGYYVRLESALAASGIKLNITPKPEGSIVATTDQLTVKTNAKNGYKVYLALNNQGKLYHGGTQTAEASKIINSTSGTMAAPKVLDMNSLGFAVKKTAPKAAPNNFDDNYNAGAPGASFMPAENSKWAGIAVAGSGITQAFLGAKNAHTAGDKLDIYYGVKVNNALAPGEYKGSVTYTAVADHTSTPNGTVSPNIITNPAVPNQITIKIPLFTSYTLAANQIAVRVDDRECTGVEIAKNDNTELVVKCMAPAKPAGGKARVVINVPVFAAPIEIAGGVEYKVVDLGSIETMQEMTPEICAATNQPDTVQKTLRDTRDNKTYTVIKAKDGNCWMTQNLALELKTSDTFTSANTDLPSNKPSWTPENTTQTSAGTAWNTSGGQYYDYERTHARSFKVPTSANGNSDGKYGVLYNWYAATGGTTDHNFNTKGQDAPGSICPKGWQLPNGKDHNVDKSFAKLYKAYNPGYSGSGSYGNINAGNYLMSSPLNFKYSGHYINSGSYNIAGTYGYYWSSSVRNHAGAYHLRFYSSNVNPQDVNPRIHGFAVRCVAR